MTVVAAGPQNPLPEPPATIGDQVSWSLDAPEILGFATTVTGPVLLTPDGVTALNPADGTPLWTYQHDAAYDEERLVVSPDGHHVAVRIVGPSSLRLEDGSEDGSRFYTTIVLDAVSGRPVLTHMSYGGRLQLTDSAVLDGDTALSLTDGSRLWGLGDAENQEVSAYREGRDEGCRYSGPAGHASFILGCEDVDSESDWGDRFTLAVAPETDPTAIVQVDDILADPLGWDIPTVKGWVAQGTGENAEALGQSAQAVSLDSLAGVEGADETVVALGTTTGINELASRASGTLVTYPLYDPEAQHPDISFDASIPQAETIFDPRTLTTRPASQDRGLATALIGVVVTRNGEDLGAEIRLQSRDSSVQASIPLESERLHTSPLVLAARSEGMNPLVTAASKHLHLTTFTAPGTTIVALPVITNAEEERHSFLTYPHPYRIIGLTGGDQ